MTSDQPRCGACRQFRSAAVVVESEIPGLRVLGSGYSSVRAGDGLCERFDRYLSDHHRCEYFAGRPATG